MDRLMVVREVFQLQAIEGDSLCADGDLGQEWPDLGVEAVFVHAEEIRSFPETYEPLICHFSGRIGRANRKTDLKPSGRRIFRIASSKPVFRPRALFPQLPPARKASSRKVADREVRRCLQ